MQLVSVSTLYIYTVNVESCDAMAFLLALLCFLCFLTVWDLGASDPSWVSTSDNVFSLLVISHGCTCTTAVIQSFCALHFYLTLSERSCLVSVYNVTKQRLLIVFLLLLSGNVQPNPGPEMQCIQTPSDFFI